MSYNINWVELSKQQFDFCKENKIVVLKSSFNTNGGLNNWISVSFCLEKSPFNPIVIGTSQIDFNTAFSNAKKQFLKMFLLFHVIWKNPALLLRIDKHMVSVLKNN